MNLSTKRIPDDVVGYLVVNAGDRGHRVVGLCCADKREVRVMVWRVNIEPYRQTCCECGTVLVEGTLKTELFDGR